MRASCATAIAYPPRRRAFGEAAGSLEKPLEEVGVLDEVAQVEEVLYGMVSNWNHCSFAYIFRVRTADNKNAQDKVSEGCKPYYTVTVQCRRYSVDPLWNPS
jgi:hypothetical protein